MDRTYKVLLVEDDLTTHSYHQLILEQIHCTVDVVNIRQLEKDCSPMQNYDATILHLKLPNQRGDVIIQRLQMYHRKVHIIVANEDTQLFMKNLRNIGR
jgi:DNA-binding response OmpR family regulator